MIIIALKGKNGSGKSTVAKFLSQKLTEKGVTNKVLAFAEPLKKIFNKMSTQATGLEFDFENRNIKTEFRKDLEHIADSIKDSFTFNPFVVEILNQLDLVLSYDGTVAIISDLRFESEYNGLYNYVGADEQLIVVEIKNNLTDNNPPEYDELLIKADKTLVFNSKVGEQIDALVTELL